MKRRKGVGDPCPYCHRPLEPQLFIQRSANRSRNHSYAKTLRRPDAVSRPYHGIDRQIYDLAREGETVLDIARKLNLLEKYVLGMTQLMEKRGHI